VVVAGLVVILVRGEVVDGEVLELVGNILPMEPLMGDLVVEEQVVRAVEAVVRDRVVEVIMQEPLVVEEELAAPAEEVVVEVESM
jgi:hypothetical protein